MDYKITGYEPEKLFHFFEEISAIPRGSGNEKGISDYLVKFAKDRGLEVIQDDAYNVVIKKAGSRGAEDHAPVMLQGHMDMVCEKRAGVEHDFEKDGLDLKNNRKHLTIEAYTSGSRLYMKVRDNGRGMTQEQIEELLKKKGKKTKGLTAVGIPNIQERLQLYYGTQAKLSRKSSGEGTEATIYLPVNRSEDEES